MSSHFKIAVRASKIEGRGAFALEQLPARRKLGNMAGEIISEKLARKRALANKRISIVEFGNGKALDASAHSKVLRFINHSCQPNTYLRVAYEKVEFYTLRIIKPGEELTCNYGETHHEGKLRCRCGAPGCRGFL